MQGHLREARTVRRTVRVDPEQMHSHFGFSNAATPRTIGEFDGGMRVVSLKMAQPMAALDEGAGANASTAAAEGRPGERASFAPPAGPRNVEQDLYATCGGLLGAIEALAYELPEQPPPRTARALRDARAFAQDMRDQLDALMVLALPDLEGASPRTPFGLGRWIEHAARGADVRLAAFGTRLDLPALSSLEGLQVPLAVSRMDRALTVMVEQLGRLVGSAGVLRLGVQVTETSMDLTIAAYSTSGDALHVGTSLSPLFLRAWERLLAWHGGTLRHTTLPLTLTLTLTLALPFA